MAVNKTKDTRSNNDRDHAKEIHDEPKTYGSREKTSFGLFNMFGSASRGGEDFENIYKACEMVIEQTDVEGMKFEVLRFLRKNYSFDYSAILICARIENVVIYHALPIEATGKPSQTDYRVTMAGTHYTLPTYPSMSIDDNFFDACSEMIASHFRIDVKNVFSTEATMVWKELNTESVDDVEELVYKAFAGLYVETAAGTKGFKAQPVSEMGKGEKGDFVLSSTFYSHEAIMTDTVAMPIRQDITVDIKFKRPDQDHTHANQADSCDDILRTGLYVDFAKLPERRDRRRRDDDDEYTHAAKLIITNQQAPSQTLFGEHLSILGVASVAYLNEDKSYMIPFLHRQAPANGKAIYNDAAMLNIEGRLKAKDGEWGEPAPIYEQSKRSPEDRLDDLFQLLVDPEPSICIDIPDVGPDAIMLSIYRDIADDEGPAIRRMNEVIRTLLGGHYDTISTPMFADVQNDIHGGYYRDGSNVYDIRRISAYLAVAQHAYDTKDPALIERYNETLEPGSLDLQIPANERLEILEDMAKSKIIFKHNIRRLTFNGRWIANLVEQLRDAGFRPLPDGNNNRGRRSSSRAFDYSKTGISSGLRITDQRNTGVKGSYNRGYRRSYYDN